MSPGENAGEFFARYGLDDVARFSDPARALYRRFDLRRARWLQFFGLSVWLRAARAVLAEGHGTGAIAAGDGIQMPGAFLVLDGNIVQAYRHDTAASRPGYTNLAAV